MSKLNYIRMGTNQYIEARGPEGLSDVLTTLSEQSKNDPAFASINHQIAYLIGSQCSAIQANFSDNSQPKIWYNDIDNRPATMSVRNVVATFLSQNQAQKSEEKSQKQSKWYGLFYKGAHPTEEVKPKATNQHRLKR